LDKTEEDSSLSLHRVRKDENLTMRRNEHYRSW